MNNKTSKGGRFLRPFLIYIAIVQIILGVATAFFPGMFFAEMGLTVPAADNHYILGMLASRFLAFGVTLFIVMRDPARHRLLLQMMLAIQVLDLTAGLTYTGMGTIGLGVSAFPMFNATLIATLLFVWMPKQGSAPSERNQ